MRTESSTATSTPSSRGTSRDRWRPRRTRWRYRGAGSTRLRRVPSSPRPSSPSLPPVRREKREKFVEETLVGERLELFHSPSLPADGGEAGREGGRGL